MVEQQEQHYWPMASLTLAGCGQAYSFLIDLWRKRTAVSDSAQGILATNTPGAILIVMEQKQTRTGWGSSALLRDTKSQLILSHKVLFPHRTSHNIWQRILVPSKSPYTYSDMYAKTRHN